MKPRESHFRLLGTPAFSSGGKFAPLPDTLPARLVALLALRQGAVHRSELAGIFYPDQPDSVARQRIRLQLSRARKLDPGLPLRSSAHYVSCIAMSDVHELLQEVGERNWLAASSRPAPRLLGTWELQPDLAAELQPLQEQLGEAWLLAVTRQAQNMLAQNETEAAFALLLRATASEPTAEAVLQLLLQVARTAGRPREAAAAFAAFRQAVAPLDPLPETTELHRQLLAHGQGTLPDSGHVQNAAAILGEHATPGTIAEVVNAPVTDVVQVLGELERRGRLDDQGRLRKRTATLELLTGVEKRFLHGQAARALRHAGLPFVEGEHWLLAGDSERAAAAWFPATTGLFSREIGRQQEALAFYERILALPVRSPAWYAASAYYALQQLQLEGQAPARARVEQVLLESADPVARTFAFIVRSHLQLANGKVAAAAESMHLAELQSRDTNSIALQRDVLFSQARLLYVQGKTAAALKLADDMVESLRLEPPRQALLSWLSMQAGLLCDEGRFEAALASFREQLLLARSLGFPRDEVRVVADILSTLNDMGRAGEGLELGFQALELGEFDVTWPLRFSLAEALAALGRSGEALAQLDKIAAGDATVTTKGHALALKLKLAGPAGGVLEQALDLAFSTDLPAIRIVIAAAAAGLEPGVPPETINRLLEGIGSDQVPAWLAESWRQLQDFQQRQLIRS